MKHQGGTCHRFLFSVRRVVHYCVQFPLNIQQMYCLDTIFHVMSTKLASSLRHITCNISLFFLSMIFLNYKI